MTTPPSHDTISQVCLIVALFSTVGLLIVGYELQAGVHRDLAAVEQEARHLGRELDAVTALRRAATLAQARALERAITKARAGTPRGPVAVVAEPDGEVVFSEPSLAYAWINRGRRHGLQLKTRFLAYQYTRSGRRRVKGELRVARVEADLAQCEILKADPGNPVVRGDLIRVVPSPAR